MGWLRFIIRLPLVLLYILSGFLMIVILHATTGRLWYQRQYGKTVIRRWMKVLAFLIGLKIHVTGKPVEGLLAANHISWMDIIGLDTIIASRFVSKDDVLRWPIIGLLPKWSGTFFLKRGSAAAVSRLNNEIQHALTESSTVAVFPEGATQDGRKVHRFFSAILQAGIDAEVPVQAVAIRYVRNGKRDEVASFVGNISFPAHVLNILKVASTNVFFHFCDPIMAKGMTRKELAEHLQVMVEEVFESEPQCHT